MLLILFALIYTSDFMLQASGIYAQEISLSIAPPLIKTTIKPGKSILIGYKLQNQGDPTILTSYVTKIVPIGNDGGLKIESGPTDPIMFELDNADLKLKQPYLLHSDKIQQLLLRIKVPAETPEGDYYFTLLTETKPNQMDSDLTTSTKATIGSNILLTVTKSGKTDINGKIILFDVIPRFKLPILGNVFDSTDQIPVRLIINNTGHNIIVPEGKISLIGNFGEKASFDIIPKNILTNSQRLMEATTSAQLKHKAGTTMIINGFFVGRYNLISEVNFGAGTQIHFSQANFTALPIKLTAGLITIVSIIWFVLSQYKKQTS